VIEELAMHHLSHPFRRLVPLLRLAAILALAPLLSHCQAIDTDTNLIEARNNTRPVARTGADGEAPVGAELQLDGTSSYDPDGDEISYHWAVESRPASSALSASPFSVNGDRNSGSTTVIPDVEGVFVFSLQVEDPAGVRSNTDRVIYRIKSTLDLPIADAGSSISGLEGVPMCLDGGESYDPNGLPLEFQWSLVSVAGGSTLTDADLDTTDAQCCITADVPGTSAVRLVVNNGLEDSEPDFAFVGAASTNEGPQAVAEVVSAASCDFIRLTAQSSVDPEADALNYLWEVLVVPNGSGVTTGSSAFDDSTSATPSFYADIAGEYTIQLVVSDGEAFSVPVFLDIQVGMTSINSPPIVIPTPDAYLSNSGPSCPSGTSGQYCPEAIIALDALDSVDPDGDFMTFSWEVVTLALPSGSPACYTLDMRDSYGDGWNGASLQVHENGAFLGSFDVSTSENGGSSSAENFCVAENSLVEIFYSGGSWDSEVSYDVLDSAGGVIFSQPRVPGIGPPDGLAHSFTASLSSVSTAQLLSTTGAEVELSFNGPSSCSGEINTYEVEVIVTGTDCVGDSSQATVALVYHCGN